jgi:hypothetical protein
MVVLMWMLQLYDLFEDVVAMVIIDRLKKKDVDVGVGVVDVVDVVGVVGVVGVVVDRADRANHVYHLDDGYSEMKMKMKMVR